MAQEKRTISTQHSSIGDRFNSALETSLQWSKLALRPSLATGLASIVTLLATSLLLRQLPVDEAGHFALLIALSEIFGLIAGHGFPTVITRRYSAEPNDYFAWRSDLLATLVWAVPLLALTGLAANLIYTLSPFNHLYLFLSSLLRVGLYSFIFMLNAHQQYARSALLLRLPNSLLLLPALISWISPSYATLPVVLVFHTCSFLMIFISAIAFFGKSLGSGKQRISWHERKNGLIFLLSSATLILPDQGFLVIGGAFLGAAELATFAAAAVFLRPFKFIRNVLGMIMMPEFIRRKASEHRTLLTGLVVLGFGLSIAVALLGPPVFRWFYADRYQAGFGIIPLLAIAGLLHLSSVFPRTYIGGRGSQSFVTQAILSQSVGLVIALAAGSIGTVLAGPFGLALAVISVEATRLVISLFYWRKLRRNEALEYQSVETSL